MKKSIHIIFLILSFSSFSQTIVKRVGIIDTYQPQEITIDNTSIEISPMCRRIIINATGVSPEIIGVKFGNGSTDNIGVSFVIYNGGTSTLTFQHLSVSAGTGNKINCWGANKTLLQGEHADIIYNSNTNQFDFFK